MTIITSVFLGALSVFLFIPWAAMILAVALGLSLFILAPVSAVLLIGVQRRQQFRSKAIADWRHRVHLVRGFKHGDHATEDFRWGLTRAMLAQPPLSGSVACSCIKSAGDQYLGVVRICSRGGNFCLKVRDQAREAVASRLMERFDEFAQAFPVREGAPLVEDGDCNEGICPLGENSLFSIQRERKARYWFPVAGLARNLVPAAASRAVNDRYSITD